MLNPALGIALAVLAVGCGGDDALSKQEYVSKLNAICEDFSEKEEEIGEPQSVAELAERGPRILDAFEKTVIDKVRDLEAPDEIADQADRLLDIAHRQRDVIDQLVGAAKDNDFARVRELDSRNKALNNEANSIALELGARACATR